MKSDDKYELILNIYMTISLVVSFISTIAFILLFGSDLLQPKRNKDNYFTIDPAREVSKLSKRTKEGENIWIKNY